MAGCSPRRGDRFSPLALALPMALVVAACGGGGPTPSPEPTLPTAQEYRSQAETQPCPEGLFLGDQPGRTAPNPRRYTSPFGEVPCPDILSIQERGIQVRWSAGGCVKFRELTLEEEDDEIIVTSVVEDARPVHRVTLVDGKPLHWACTLELVEGVEFLELEAPLSQRRLLTQVRLLPPSEPG